MTLCRGTAVLLEPHQRGGEFLSLVEVGPVGI